MSGPQVPFGLRRSLVALGAILVAACCGASTVQAQTFLMMPDSTNNRMVLFNPTDGSLVNSNYFALAAGTPIHALQVGNEIWLSEQIGDRVSRWSLTGTFLGAIGPTFTGGGLDNVRGMGLIGNTVYVTNSGTNNGAPGNSVLSFDTAGNFLSSFSTVGLAPSPFGILAYQGGMLVSSSSANDDIHNFTLAGASIGTFHNTASLNFAEQMDYAANGDVLAAGFSSNNVVRLDPTTGAFISQFTASGARGVWQLDNGNILWTSGAGAFVFDAGTGGSTQVYTGGGRYIGELQLAAVPEPTVCLLGGLGLAGAYFARRRRRAKLKQKAKEAAPAKLPIQN